MMKKCFEDEPPKLGSEIKVKKFWQYSSFNCVKINLGFYNIISWNIHIFAFAGILYKILILLQIIIDYKKIFFYIWKRTRNW